MSAARRPASVSELTPGPSTNEKGALPPNTPSSSLVTAAKKRTRHACDRCRLMRTKCSGGRRCDRCTKDDAVCVYGDHKRERNKKDLAESLNRIKELEEENHNLISALRHITASPGFRSADHEDVMNLLATYQDEDYRDDSENSQTQSRSIFTPTTNPESRSERGGEHKVYSVIGSPGKQGELQKLVDLSNGTGLVGYIGKMSEIDWLHRCHEHLGDRPRPTPAGIDSPELALDSRSAAAVDCTYFVDEQDLLTVDENQVNALQWPSAEAAIVMTEAYFHATDGAFRFLSREAFLDTMYQLPKDSMPLTWDKLRWLALANMTWAIGAKWLQVTKLETSEFLESHLVYYARARALGLDHRISFDHPNVEMVQGIGNLALYLLVNGSISRAWNAVGHGVHHATSLGLHLRVTDPAIDHCERNSRAQLWFSLYRLQILLAEITGRPQLIRSAHVTVSLEDLDELDPSSACTTTSGVALESSSHVRDTWLEYMNMKVDIHKSGGQGRVIPDFQSLTQPVPKQTFVYQVRLCQLSEEVADRLYTDSRDVLWIDTQAKIEELQRGLDAWTVTLPEELKLSQAGLRQQPRAGIELAMYSYSISMIIHRACLCEIQIEHESIQSRKFNWKSARACVSAAMAMVEIMPDELDEVELYQILPLWTALHYLCQALSVLLLELSLDAQHFQGESRRILGLAWRAMAYLSKMASNSRSAYRAWNICNGLLERLARRHADIGVEFPPVGIGPLH